MPAGEWGDSLVEVDHGDTVGRRTVVHVAVGDLEKETGHHEVHSPRRVIDEVLPILQQHRDTDELVACRARTQNRSR